MKNYITIIIVFYFVTISLKSQPHIWKEVLFIPSDIYFANFYNGVVLDSNNVIVPYSAKDIEGIDGTVLGLISTSNGGLTWEHILKNFKVEGTKTTIWPTVVEYVSNEDIFVGAKSNYILKTNDGGKSWTPILLPYLKRTDSYGYDEVVLLSMYDKNYGIALSDSEPFSVATKLYSTKDGWKTFKEVKVPQDYYIIQASSGTYSGYIKCLGKNIFVCKILNKKTKKNEYLARTTDGGETWKIIEDPVNSYIPKDSIQGRTIKFLDTLNGWCLGHIYPKDVIKETTHGYISKTTDGGNSWQFVEHIEMPIDPDTINHNRNNYYMDYFRNDKNFMLATPFSSRRDKLGKWLIDSTEEVLYWRKFYYKSKYNITPIYMGVNESKVYKDFGEYTPSNIIEYGIAINVSITPNPAHNKATIQIEKDKGEGNVSLYNILGEQVKRKDFLNESPISLDLSGIPAGCYNAVIKTKCGITIKKIIVE
ncbi:MAG: T9SS type A sorting domain-containing protein [Chlorobiota bacterium]|nr:T9SS type A sorting domain-containing protein [Chlorobiota bacterium]QQS67387.1 MAG: T9SS type A sorting domain-containing protein [Chlorobiota bacterium]